MPWWSWVVIWVALALALLGMLVWMAVRLFRKAGAVLDELDALASAAELLDRAAEVATEQHTELAILVGAEEMRRRRALVRADALARRSARRAARIIRAKALTRVDASTREWFSEH